MKRAISLKRTLAMAPVLLLLGGCIIHESEGDLTLRWSCEGYACESVGVTATHVELFDFAGVAFPIEYLEYGATGVSYQELDTGIYHFHITGFDSVSRPIYGIESDADVHTGDNVYSDIQLLLY